MSRVAVALTAGLVSACATASKISTASASTSDSVKLVHCYGVNACQKTIVDRYPAALNS